MICKSNRLAHYTEKTALFFYKIVKKLSKRYQLSITCGVEHFTAICSHAILSNIPFLFTHDIIPFTPLWLWHSIDESEHKSTAFDVLAAVTPNSYWRYLLRINAIFVVTIFYMTVFPFNIMVYRLGRYVSRSSFPPKTPSLLRMAFFWPTIKTLIIHYFAFYRFSFHPGDLDNTELLKACKQNYAHLFL